MPGRVAADFTRDLGPYGVLFTTAIRYFGYEIVMMVPLWFEVIILVCLVDPQY